MQFCTILYYIYQLRDNSDILKTDLGNPNLLGLYVGHKL